MCSFESSVMLDAVDGMASRDRYLVLGSRLGPVRTSSPSDATGKLPRKSLGYPLVPRYGARTLRYASLHSDRKLEPQRSLPRYSGMQSETELRWKGI